MGKRARSATPSEVFSHWFQMIEGLAVTPSDFYSNVETQIKSHGIPDVKIEQVTCKEGGAFSAKRIYLRVTRKGKIFDICGAPFGSGFFVSWWLGERPAGAFKQLAVILSYVPFIGGIFEGAVSNTYYKIDTTLMFQQSVHAAVTSAVDEIVKTQGLKPLTELDKKPTMNL